MRYKILNLETGEYLKSPSITSTKQIQKVFFDGYIDLVKSTVEKDSVFSCEEAADLFLEQWRFQKATTIMSNDGYSFVKKPSRDLFEIVKVEDAEKT